MKNHNKIAFQIIFLLVLGGLVSCKTTFNKDFAGPSICATEKFAFIQQPTLSSSTVNLASQTMTFSASFNEQVPWTLVIRGLTSKSFKKYSGYGSTINIVWKGNPDTTVFFQAEQCTADFQVACRTAVRKNFTITSVNSFSNFDYLVYNGDGGGLATGPFSYGTYATHGANSILNSPQGGNCFCTNGNSGTTPVWYFGGYDFNVVLTSALISNPKKVYFNMFLNVKNSQGTIPVVTFKEGTVQRNVSLNIKNSGWNYVSFPLSDANVVDPRNINTISFGLNAYPAQATSGDMCIDFVSFTNNSPFIGQ